MKKTYWEIFDSITQSASLFSNTFTDSSVETTFIKKMISETEKWLIKRYETNVRKQVDTLVPTVWVADYNLDFYAPPCILSMPFSYIDRLYYRFVWSSIERPIPMVWPWAMQKIRSNLTVSSLRLTSCCVEWQLLKFYPTPASNQIVIYIVYDALYESLNVTTSLATESCKMLEWFEHLLELKTLQRIFMQREQNDIALVYHNEYLEVLAEYSKAAKQQNTISPLVPYIWNRNWWFIFAWTLTSS